MIYINGIPSFRAPEEEELTLDDRVQKVDLLFGEAVVQDFGYVEKGDVFSLKCMFTEQNFKALEKIWLKRNQTVSYKDEAGVVWKALKLKLLKISRVRRYPDYVTVTFELYKTKRVLTATTNDDEDEDYDDEEED